MEPPFVPDSNQSPSGVDVAITAHHLQPVPALLLEDVGLGSVIGNLVLELVLGWRCAGLHGSLGRGWAGRFTVQTPESFGNSLNKVRVTMVTLRTVTIRIYVPERLLGITYPRLGPQSGRCC